MTIPYMMNCSHIGDGWCLACVKVIHDEHQEMMGLVRELVHKAKRRIEEQPYAPDYDFAELVRQLAAMVKEAE